MLLYERQSYLICNSHTLNPLIPSRSVLLSPDERFLTVGVSLQESLTILLPRFSFNGTFRFGGDCKLSLLTVNLDNQSSLWAIGATWTRPAFWKI